MGTSCSCACNSPRSSEALTKDELSRNGDASPTRSASIGFSAGFPMLEHNDTPEEAKKEPETSPMTCSTQEPPASLPSPTAKAAEDAISQRLDMEGGNQEASDKLQSSLDYIKMLCAEGRALQAFQALTELETQARSLNPAFLERMEKDPIIIALRMQNKRVANTLECVTQEALPGGPSDHRWVSTTLTDKDIDPDFKADIKIRFAVGKERDPKGPSSQAIVVGCLTSFPLNLESFIAVYKETDLYQKDWIADCESCDGKVGGLEKMNSALSHIINASPILPVRLEVCTIRDFAVCQTAPVPEKGPGVLVIDRSPPHDAKTTYAGWDLPPTKSRMSRLDANMVLYFTPRPEKPGYVDVFAFAKVGVSLPQWLVPLNLVKRFLASHFVSVFKATKHHIADSWDTLGYKDRIREVTQFYDAVKSIREAA